jgi:hypothetical protein
MPCKDLRRAASNASYEPATGAIGEGSQREVSYFAVA